MKALALVPGFAAGVLAWGGTRRENQVPEKGGKENRKRCKSIEGTWHNQLGSKVVIKSDPQTGVLEGTYSTAVANKGPLPKPSKLVGQTSLNGEYDTFGMTVLWRGGNSVSSWTGQCQVCNGEETLMTMWILASEVDSCQDSWKAHQIGQDVFKRHPFDDGQRTIGDV